MLPLLPNWRVPGFIRRCDVICYLNRNFVIPKHTPVIPREVMACGRCLVVSEEVRQIGWYRDSLRNGETCLAVADPRDIDGLAAVLRRAVSDPGLTKRIDGAAYLEAKSM